VITAYTDGGSRGNPGPAGYGVRIEDDKGQLIEELYESLGVATNNVAEYRGLLAALRWARDRRVTSLRVRSDSELLVKQMKGIYRVKHPGLQPLHHEAQQLARQIGRVVFEHVRREQNAEADRLANHAMDDAAQAPQSRSQSQSRSESQSQSQSEARPPSQSASRSKQTSFDW
jgi:probable phosphoglycerate mutase